MAGMDARDARPFLKRKKAMRPGSLDWEDHFQSVPSGPTSLEDLYSWPQTALGILRERRPGCLDLLEHNMTMGGSIITHYSGKGTAEHVFADIGEYLRVEMPSLQTLPEQRFVAASACDATPLCREVLNSCGRFGPRHLFGDIRNRIPQQNPPLAGMSPEDVRKYLSEHGAELYTPEAEAYCYRCWDMCPIWSDLELPASPTERRGLLVSAAGFSCTDWSPRRTGKRPGLAGASAPIFFHWLEENKRLRPDILFWENSASFRAEALTDALGAEYVHEFCEMGPDLLGWPQTRPRLFGVAVLRETCLLTGTASEFLSWFLKKVELDGDIFFQAPQAEVDEMMQELAQARGHGRVESPTLNMALPPSSMVALQEYAQIRAARAGVTTGAFLCDLEQSPGYAASGSFLPSCPTHSSVYSFKHGRIMTGKEMLGAMGS